MALKKPISYLGGTTLEYIKLAGVNIDVCLYKDEAARRADDGSYFTDTLYLDNDEVKAALYPLIKAKFYPGAEDV